MTWDVKQQKQTKQNFNIKTFYVISPHLAPKPGNHDGDLQQNIVISVLFQNRSTFKMALSCLERNRGLYKELLRKDIVHGEKLLSESYKIIDLDKFSIRLNQCIRLLKINSDNSELTHEKYLWLPQRTLKKDILAQIENDFHILDSAIDVRMALEDCEKETQDKIKELNVTAKLSALSKRMDTLLLATGQQMEMVCTNQLIIKESNIEYPVQLSR